jgi:sulfoxide reductase heme-binding subunit YedZ
MWRPSPRTITWIIKPPLHLACLSPATALLIALFTSNLGVNPVETLTHETGRWSLRILLVTLLMTPLRKLTRDVWWIQLRRMLGLYAFFYACVHFLIFMFLDLEWNLAELWTEIVKRPYITVGFTAFCLMIPLAVTSPLAIRRRMAHAWIRLHRLIYAVGIAALLHFWWIQKADIREPFVYCLIFTALMLFRVPWPFRRRPPVVISVRPRRARWLPWGKGGANRR